MTAIHKLEDHKKDLQEDRIDILRNLNGAGKTTDDYVELSEELKVLNEQLDDITLQFMIDEYKNKN